MHACSYTLRGGEVRIMFGSLAKTWIVQAVVAALSGDLWFCV